MLVNMLAQHGAGNAAALQMWSAWLLQLEAWRYAPHPASGRGARNSLATLRQEFGKLPAPM
jgi:hypothetical protein